MRVDLTVDICHKSRRIDGLFRVTSLVARQRLCLIIATDLATVLQHKAHGIRWDIRMPTYLGEIRIGYNSLPRSPPAWDRRFVIPPFGKHQSVPLLVSMHISRNSRPWKDWVSVRSGDSCGVVVSIVAVAVVIATAVVVVVVFAIGHYSRGCV